MQANEVVILVFVGLALAARIAGSKYFEGVDSKRAKIDGARCRCASWAFLFMLGVITIFQATYPIIVRIAAGASLIISVGGLVWDIMAVQAMISHLYQQEMTRR